MSDTAIRVHDLGKKYQLGALHQVRYSTLRDSITDLFNGRTPRSNDEIWALRNVSFDVRQGQVLGVIGRNGAGKSTLLKLLSRVTEPTEGEAEIRGRVGSLLEVGTGFHPELTGREKEVIRLVSLGCTVREAAVILKLAPHTVDNHKARAMSKLGTDKAALLTGNLGWRRIRTADVPIRTCVAPLK